MTATDRICLLRQLIMDLRALIQDEQYWSKDANRIADLEKAVESIDEVLEKTL